MGVSSGSRYSGGLGTMGMRRDLCVQSEGRTPQDRDGHKDRGGVPCTRGDIGSPIPGMQTCNPHGNQTARAELNEQHCY